MAGANYMGGKRNAIKARSKNPVLRAQKDFFGRQRLGLGPPPKAMLPTAIGTAQGIGTAPSEICLHHAKRRRWNSAYSEENYGFVPGPTPGKPPVSRLILEASGSSNKRSKVLDALDETDPMFIRVALDRVLKMPDLAGLLPRAPIQMPVSGAKRRRTDLDIGSRDNNKRQHLLYSPADRYSRSPEGQVLCKTHHEHERLPLPNQRRVVTQLGSSLPDSSIPSSDLALTSSPSSLGLRQPGSPEFRTRSCDVSKDAITVENLLYQDDPWQALDILLDLKPSSIPHRSTSHEDHVASRLDLNPLREYTNNMRTGASILNDERHDMSKTGEGSRRYLSSDSPPQQESSASLLSLNVFASDRVSKTSRSSKRSHRPARFFVDSVKPPHSDSQAGYISGSEILEVSSHHGDSSSRLSSPLHHISSASWNLSPNFALRHASPQSNKNEFDATDSSPHNSLLEPAFRSPAVCPDRIYAIDSPLQHVLSVIDAASPPPLGEDIGQYSTCLPLDGAYFSLQRQSLNESNPSSPAGDYSEHVFFDDPAGPDLDGEAITDIPGIDPYNEDSNPPIHANQTVMTSRSVRQSRFNPSANVECSVDVDDELDSPDEVETVDQPYLSHNAASVAQINTSTAMTNRNLSDPRSPLDASSLLLRKDEGVYLGPCLFSDEGEGSD
ncbi:hypothetical protein BDN71DRAFT_1588829 [Pleurotus eryngii]|uniref:Uncharacterized protein n=1 Tax=Pleurotus eryngii TaxID=5323 RepID=A0A9P6A0V7_PLEER|nr:hypothetical protein BDN71DRAFT_1588829 [Pleurotus eryngii]